MSPEEQEQFKQLPPEDQAAYFQQYQGMAMFSPEDQEAFIA